MKESFAGQIVARTLEQIHEGGRPYVDVTVSADVDNQLFVRITGSHDGEPVHASTNVPDSVESYFAADRVAEHLLEVFRESLRAVATKQEAG